MNDNVADVYIVANEEGEQLCLKLHRFAATVSTKYLERLRNESFVFPDLVALHFVRSKTREITTNTDKVRPGCTCHDWPP